MEEACGKQGHKEASTKELFVGKKKKVLIDLKYSQF